jgi:hypothetical protein
MTDDPFERAAHREHAARSAGEYARRWSHEGVAVRALLPPVLVWAGLFWWHYRAARGSGVIGRTLLWIDGIAFAFAAFVTILTVYAWFIRRGMRKR